PPGRRGGGSTSVMAHVIAGGRGAASDPPPSRRLLAEAERLFGEHGYRRTTVAMVCARAGIATGSFYAHFDSKAEIFAAVVRAINADLRAAMAAALRLAAGNQRARERAAFRAYFDLIQHRPWIFRILREAEFVDPGLYREYYERLVRGYSRGVRAAQLAGEIDARYDPEVIAFVYTGLGHFVGMRWAEWTAGGRVPDDVFEDLMGVLERGLPPDGGQTQATESRQPDPVVRRMRPGGAATP
ncbi:MAG: TetR/AcrR family transcriptional regulator, partial [Actinobacteria bacterium]|nr:TetR/AcrR family transcriptional regulator [Actinomycetota bacterium]